MIRDHARFKDLAAGFQSIAVVCAIVSGGAWAVLTLEAQRARVDYERLLREARALRAVTIELSPQILTDPTTRRPIVLIVAKLRNTGRSTESLYWTDSAMVLTPVSLGRPDATKPTSILAHRLSPAINTEAGLRLMPGIQVTRLFLAPLPGAGLYHVQFTADASWEEQQLAQEEGASGQVTWREDSYVLVPRPGP